MRTVLSLFALLVLIAPPTLAQEPGEPERAVFTMSIGDSLVVVDSLVRTDDRLVSRVVNLHRARFLLEADLRDDESVDRIHMVVWPWDRTVEDEPAIDIVLRPVGKFLMRETDDGLAVVREIEAGTYPYLNPSLAFAEQEILHAREKADGRKSVTLPMWSPYGGEGEGSTWTDTIVFVEPDSVRISGWSDTVSTYEIDDTGRIVSGRMDPVGYVIERTTLAGE